MESVTLTPLVKQALESHALQSSPAECCGILSGDGLTVTTVHRLRNQADHPETRYDASPEDTFAAMRSIRQLSQNMMGIYHSHPATPAYPSQSDIDLAFYSDSIYFIISLAAAIPDIRAFRIREDQVTSVAIVIGDNSP